MYPVSEPRCQAETFRIQSWSDSCPVARWGAKSLKMCLTSSHSDFIWHLRRPKFTDSWARNLWNVLQNPNTALKYVLFPIFLRKKEKVQHSYTRNNIKICYYILMYVPCMLYSLLPRPTNEQYIFIKIILYIVSTPWRCCGCIETCRSTYDI